MVDTFTGWMPARPRPARCVLGPGLCRHDGAVAYGLANGTVEAMRSGETTMQLQLVVWPVIGSARLSFSSWLPR